MRLHPSRLRRIAAQATAGLAYPAAFRQAFASLLCQPDSPSMSIRLRLSCGLSEQATPLIKIRLLRQRACNEKNEKAKICAGHLKRWFASQEEWISRFGPDAELYRCEKCKTIYLPNPEEAPRTATLAW